MNIDDIQIGGDHYKTDEPESQHWNAMIAVKANYFQGVITKYVDRFRHKNGAEDLEKALHYSKKYQNNVYPPTYSGIGAGKMLKPILAKHGPTSTESLIIVAVMCNDMGNAIAMIQGLIDSYEDPTEPGRTYVSP